MMSQKKSLISAKSHTTDVSNNNIKMYYLLQLLITYHTIVFKDFNYISHNSFQGFKCLSMFVIVSDSLPKRLHDSVGHLALLGFHNLC